MFGIKRGEYVDSWPPALRRDVVGASNHPTAQVAKSIPQQGATLRGTAKSLVRALIKSFAGNLTSKGSG